MRPSKKPHLFRWRGWWFCGVYGRMINGCASGRSPIEAWLEWTANP